MNALLKKESTTPAHRNDDSNAKDFNREKKMENMNYYWITSPTNFTFTFVGAKFFKKMLKHYIIISNWFHMPKILCAGITIYMRLNIPVHPSQKKSRISIYCVMKLFLDHWHKEIVSCNPGLRKPRHHM